MLVLLPQSPPPSLFIFFALQALVTGHESGHRRLPNVSPPLSIIEEVVSLLLGLDHGSSNPIFPTHTGLVGYDT